MKLKTMVLLAVPVVVLGVGGVAASQAFAGPSPSPGQHQVDTRYGCDDHGQTWSGTSGTRCGSSTRSTQPSTVPSGPSAGTSTAPSTGGRGDGHDRGSGGTGQGGWTDQYHAATGDHDGDCH